MYDEGDDDDDDEAASGVEGFDGLEEVEEVLLAQGLGNSIKGESMDSGTRDRLGRKTSGSTLRVPKLLDDIAAVETAVGDEEEGRAADAVEDIVISDEGRTSMWRRGM